jgi:hypothetical protein
VLNTPQRNVYRTVLRQISAAVDAPDYFDEEEQREMYEAIGNECLHRAQAIAGDTDATTSPANARRNVIQALRELSAAVGVVEGLATPETRLNAALVTVAALFPHKEGL